MVKPAPLHHVCGLSKRRCLPDHLNECNGVCCPPPSPAPTFMSEDVSRRLRIIETGFRRRSEGCFSTNIYTNIRIIKHWVCLREHLEGEDEKKNNLL